MKSYWLYYTSVLALTSCGSEKKLKWISVSNAQELPVYGDRFPKEGINDISYAFNPSMGSVIIKSKSTWECYQNLNSIFNKGGGPVMHYEISRVIRGFSEDVSIIGKNVWVFEGDEANERRDSTFYFLPEDESMTDLSSGQAGRLVMVFR